MKYKLDSWIYEPLDLFSNNKILQVLNNLQITGDNSLCCMAGLKNALNQVLQLCMASTTWSNSVITSSLVRFGN